MKEMEITNHKKVNAKSGDKFYTLSSDKIGDPDIRKSSLIYIIIND
jgi:hypothetical protein